MSDFLRGKHRRIFEGYTVYHHRLRCAMICAISSTLAFPSETLVTQGYSPTEVFDLISSYYYMFHATIPAARYPIS